MANRSLISVTGHDRIDGVVPGVKGQRAFPVRAQAVVDPFVMLDHIGPEQLPDDFYVDGQMHPHRGFETLTIMLEGTMSHVDSTGFTEKLASGSTQNMRAGNGIQHGGDMAADPVSNVFHEVQLWVTTPAAHKMDPPKIFTAHRADKPVIERSTYDIEVITGSVDGQLSPLATTQPTRVLVVRAKDGEAAVKARIEDIENGWVCMAYVLKGRVSVAGSLVDTYQLARFDNDGDVVEFTAEPGAEVLFMSGRPTDEPIVLGGPFVMNSEDEIRQAFDDLRSGHFAITAPDSQGQPSQ